MAARASCDRHWKRGRHERPGLATQRDGAAEVAVKRAVKPDQILLGQRPIQPHVVTLARRSRQSSRSAATTLPRDRRAADAARRTAAPKRSAVSERPRAGDRRSTWRRSISRFGAYPAPALPVVTTIAASAAAASHYRISCISDCACAPLSPRSATAAWSPRSRRRSAPDRDSRQFSCHNRRR